VSLPSLLLLGAGGHGRACIDVIEQDGRFRIAGLVGLPEEVGRTVLGYEVLGADAELPHLIRKFGNALVTVGQIKTAEPRIRLYDAVKQAGGMLPTVISPRAYVSRHARVGEGTIVMHGAIVNAGATVGRNCILNSRSLVEHDTTVADHCHIATAAAVNSGVQIGEATFIGSGCTVRQSARIGARCLIGMGQRVLGDCADGTWLPDVRRTG